MRRATAYCLVLVCGLSLASCVPNLPALLPPTPIPSTQLVDSSPTAQATPGITSSPTATLAPANPVSTAIPFTAIPTFTPTGSPPPLAPVTDTGTPPTMEPTSTATVLESISLDKLPPGTLYKRVRIRNRSHSQMNISLHCTTLQGLQTVLEYANVRNLSIQAPDGNYIYVVYAGGRQMSGSFSLLSVPSVTITVYADTVTVH